ncbi:MAG: hypothetical protein WBB43_27060 [Limnoraphis sp.]
MPRTIDVSYFDAHQVWLNKKQAKKFVGYKHQGTFNLALKALGISPPFNSKDLKRLLGLKLFLANSRGDTRATRQTYTWLEANADINQFLANYDIDLNQEFERRKNDFNNRQNPYQQQAK